MGFYGKIGAGLNIYNLIKDLKILLKINTLKISVFCKLVFLKVLNL